MPALSCWEVFIFVRDHASHVVRLSTWHQSCLTSASRRNGGYDSKSTGICVMAMGSNVPAPPFPSAHQLTRELDEPTRHVPSHPRVSLDDRNRMRDLLIREFCSDDLDKVASRLWWMSKQDSRNISPLHRQLVKRRAIVVTEDPKLHLVWIHDRVFIKPLPRYITSYAFWRDYLGAETGSDGRNERIRRAALGYLRTYYHLVQHESDLRVAKDPNLCLVPADITWEQFCNFTSALGNIDDQDVSPRYAYGEIRLTRLNLYAPFLLGKSHFQRVDRKSVV